MALSDVRLRTLTAPGKHFDGGGLYVEVTASGGRYWRMKYRYGGKEKRLAFGVYPDVTLKTARERRDAARALLELGQDPAVAKRTEKAKVEREASETFEVVARRWLAHQASGWTQGTHDAISGSLVAEVFPKIGARPVVHLRPRDVMLIVKGIEHRGAAETAGRVLQRIKAVFRYAVVHDVLDLNPMLDLKPSEILKPRQTRHRAAMSAGDVPAFLSALDRYQGEPTTLAALRLLMLTAVRPGELRGARWSEFDVDAAVWRIPAERMKMKTPHAVPLSDQALALIERQRALSGTRDLVFPSPFYPGKPLSENTLNSALARMGYKGEHSAHGFRALFSTAANEQGHDADAIERQLAHVERNQVRAAYDRGERLAQRASLMQWWADWLDKRKGAQVVTLPRRSA